MTSSILIEASDLIAGYQNKPIVGPVDLCLEHNDAIALVGPNGVGKTTILKTIAGLLPPLQGTITYRDTNISRMPAFARARRGVVLAGEHRGNVLRTLTVRENLELASQLVSSEPTIDPTGLFPRLGERLDQLAGTLSGGEQQMLSLSMALALEPQCLLIDEPSAGLAPIVLSDIRHVLTSLRASGLSLIIVEQRADVVRGLCDRIAVVASGRITHLGTDAGEVSNESLAATYFGNDRVI